MPRGRYRNNAAPLPLGAQGARHERYSSRKARNNVSVIFNLQTPQEATGLAELLVRQLKGGGTASPARFKAATWDRCAARPGRFFPPPEKNRRLRGNSSRSPTRAEKEGPREL
jgi:hypothetical protein